jgi:hypothetical protein
MFIRFRVPESQRLWRGRACLEWRLGAAPRGARQGAVSGGVRVERAWRRASLRCRVWSVGFRLQALGSRSKVQGLGFRIDSLGCRAEG